MRMTGLVRAGLALALMQGCGDDGSGDGDTGTSGNETGSTSSTTGQATSSSGTGTSTTGAATDSATSGTTGGPGSTGGGGSTGSSSGGGKGECKPNCEATLLADCVGGPASQDICEMDCADQLAGECATEYQALLDCAAGEEVVCSDFGLPVVEACSAEQDAFVDCVTG